MWQRASWNVGWNLQQPLNIWRGGEGGAWKVLKKEGGGNKGWTNFKKGMMKPHFELWIA